MKKKQTILCVVLAIAIIVGAYFVADWLAPVPVKLDTIVYHVCENEEIGNVTMHVPNVTDVYQQILTANKNTYPNILLFPTYAGTWEDELAWLTSNFGGANGIPIMLEVFYSVNRTENPVCSLTTTQISAAMEVSNVKWLRFAEVVSRHIEYDLTFPDEYVKTILSLCRDHNLKLFWTEWKAGTFEDVKTHISGFEDIVTVSFSTNSQEKEPADGFAHVRGLFVHWGGSVQSWYYETRHRLETGTEIDEGESRNMPISLLIDHALLCRKMGAEVIQFEPYWYFFGDTDGKARESLSLMHSSLNSQRP
jgi:hypothetical protein